MSDFVLPLREEDAPTGTTQELVTADIEECDMKMASYIEGLFQKYGIQTIDITQERDRSKRLNECMMLMEQIFSTDFSVDCLYDTCTDTYHAITRKLLMFAAPPHEIADPCVVQMESDHASFDLCTTGGSFRSLFRETTSDSMSLTCRDDDMILKYGITTLQGLDAVRRWKSGAAPRFAYFPDFENNLLPRCITLLSRQRVGVPSKTLT